MSRNCTQYRSPLQYAKAVPTEPLPNDPPSLCKATEGKYWQIQITSGPRIPVPSEQLRPSVSRGYSLLKHYELTLNYSSREFASPPTLTGLTVWTLEQQLSERKTDCDRLS
jgi:hypothetical protein